MVAANGLVEGVLAPPEQQVIVHVPDVDGVPGEGGAGKCERPRKGPLEQLATIHALCLADSRGLGAEAPGKESQSPRTYSIMMVAT